MANLTTLAAVKAYLTITTTGQDALIPMLIARESKHAEDWTGRTFPYSNNVGIRLNGTGGPILVLPETPILSVSAVSVNGTAVAASEDGVLDAGYTYTEGFLKLIGDRFPAGYANVQCSWVAGYRTSEAGYVPTGNAPTLTPLTGGTAFSAVSVTDDTVGTAMAQVGNAPASGQFSFSAGVFTFNSAQHNHLVTMTYYYVPSPVEQAVIEMVGLDLQQRSAIGMTAKSVGGETVSYERKGMTDSAKQMLQPYKRMAVGA